MQLSEYQKNIFNLFKTNDKNILINAGAGSGKTTTIVELAKNIPTNKSVIMLCFQKAVAVELQNKINKSNVECTTINAKGWDILRKNKKIKYHDLAKAESWKYINILKYGIGEDIPPFKDKWFPEGVENSYLMMYANIIKKIVKFSQLYLIDKSVNALNELCNKYEIATEFRGDYNRLINHSLEIYKLLEENDKVSWDFNDQIYYPSIKNYKIDKYDYVFVDEAQDTSPLQLNLIEKLGHQSSKYVFVGDKSQAIFAFNGSDLNSMNNILDKFNCEYTSLPITYRCSKNIVNTTNKKVTELVNEVKDYKVEKLICGNSNEGLVNHNSDFSNLSKGDTILCLNNAPLISKCLNLLSSGVSAYMLRNDLVKNKIIEYLKISDDKNKIIDKVEKDILKIMKNLQDNNKDITTSNSYIQMKDLYICVINLLNELSINESISKIEKIFSKDGDILLTTIHKSKGLEWDRVFLIQPSLLNINNKNKQLSNNNKIEKINLTYVAYTRSKKELHIVNEDIFNIYNISDSEQDDIDNKLLKLFYQNTENEY